MAPVNLSSLKVSPNNPIVAGAITVYCSNGTGAGKFNLAAPSSNTGGGRSANSTMTVAGVLGGRGGEAESFTAKMSGGLKSIRAELNNTAGGAKNFMGALLGASHPIDILMAGMNGLGKVCMVAYEHWINGMKEAGELAQRNAAGIRENAEANEALRQKSDGYLNQLADLANAEQLSNTNKAEAQKLIDDLSKSYGNLGIKIDEATGKITGIDTAITTKLQRDKSQRLQELESELKQLQADNQAQARLRDSAGMPVSFSGNVRIGGEADIQAAAKKIEENDKRLLELRRQISEQKRTDPAGDYLKKRAAENADLGQKYAERHRQLEQRKDDDQYAKLKDPEAKIANRQALIDRETNARTPLEQQAIELEKEGAKAKTEAERLEKQRMLRQIQIELVQSEEKIYSWQRQINEMESQRTAAAQALLTQADEEVLLQQMLTDGKYEEYEAEKLRQELKRQGLTLTEQETQQLLEQRKALGEENLRRNLQEKATSMKNQLLERTNRGPEAAEKQALDDARKLKGAELTEAESEMVKRLSELTQLQGNPGKEMQLGDTSIKTNSLTARGGFASGVKMPDSEKINREIAATAKLQLETVQKINSILTELTAG